MFNFADSGIYFEKKNSTFHEGFISDIPVSEKFYSSFPNNISMAVQTLTPPQDITWRRMAFSRDMIDTNFGDLMFPPKWRTSLAIYYYIVPEEETADAYPDQRIVYLKLTSSITGWNPSEELKNIKQQAAETDLLDDLQKSIWDAIEANDWASQYWPCYGAIMQLGIFPGKTDNSVPDEYPYIMDFEPKKRELFEAITEGSEALSATSDKLSVTKGSTHTFGVEIKPTFSIGPVGFGGNGVNYGYQHIDNNTTDSSRENRETKSYSSTFSQMYQLFNGYHLGTNRAVFAVFPRPHTSSSTTGSYSLIKGERQLEGLQDVFLVVTMPRSLKGFCIQASIDTGHKPPSNQPLSMAMTKTFSISRGDFSDPPCLGGTVGDPGDGGWGGGGGGGGGGTGGGGNSGDDDNGFSFIVTRRMVQSCGIFNANGLFELQPPADNPKRPHIFVGETFISTKKSMARVMARERFDPPEGGFDDCRDETIAMYNHNLARMSKSMLNIFSSGGTKLDDLKETKTFRLLFANAANTVKFTADDLLRLKYINDKEHKILKKHKIENLNDLFKPSADFIVDADVNELRNRIMRIKK
jgi:hypothetical protein